eukprot:221413_1
MDDEKFPSRYGVCRTVSDWLNQENVDKLHLLVRSSKNKGFKENPKICYFAFYPSIDKLIRVSDMDIVVKVPTSYLQQGAKDLEFKFKLDGTVGDLMANIATQLNDDESTDNENKDKQNTGNSKKVSVAFKPELQILEINDVSLTLGKYGKTRLKDVENCIIYSDTELVFKLTLEPSSGAIEEKSPKNDPHSSGYLILLYFICLISITAAVLGCYKLGNNPKRQLLSLMASLSGLIVGTSALIAAGKKPLRAKSFALCALFVFLVLAATATSLAFTKYGSGDIKSEDVIDVKIVEDVNAAEITKFNDAASHPPSLLMMGLVTGVITALVFDFCG